VCGRVEVSRALRCPASKFITHTLSHISFLILLAAATFRLDDRAHVITSTPRLFNSTYDDSDDADVSRLTEDVDNSLKDTFRPANILFTHVQICLMFWIFGKYKHTARVSCVRQSVVLPSSQLAVLAVIYVSA